MQWMCFPSYWHVPQSRLEGLLIDNCHTAWTYRKVGCSPAQCFLLSMSGDILHIHASLNTFSARSQKHVKAFKVNKFFSTSWALKSVSLTVSAGLMDGASLLSFVSWVTDVSFRLTKNTSGSSTQFADGIGASSPVTYGYNRYQVWQYWAPLCKIIYLVWR